MHEEGCACLRCVHAGGVCKWYGRGGVFTTIHFLFCQISNPTKTFCTVGATFICTLNAHVGLTLLVGEELFRANVYI